MHWAAALFFASAGVLSQASSTVERLTHSYDVRFLTETLPRFSLAGERPPAPRLALGDLDLLQLEERAGGGAGVEFSTAMVEESLVTPGLRVSPEMLVDLIRRNIAPDSWANERNSIEADENRLVVVQTPDVHQDIARLLQALQARRALLIQVEVVLAPAEALGSEGSGRSPWLTEEAYRAAIEKAGKRGRKVSLTAYNAQTASIAIGKKRSLVGDFEINQTGLLPVANPVIRVLPLGVSVEFKASSIPDTDLLRLHLKVERLAEAGESTRRETHYGEFELPVLAEEGLETDLFLRAGRPALAGFFSDGAGPEKRQLAVLARARPVDLQAEKPAPAQAPEAFAYRAHDISFLIEAVSGAEPLFEPDGLMDLVKTNVDPEAWHDERARLSYEEGGFLAVTARARTQRAVKEWLEKALADEARLAILDLRVVEGPLEAMGRLQRAAAGGSRLPPDWLESEGGRKLHETFHAESVGLTSGRRRLRGYDSRAFIEDVETVSGGACCARGAMPDPVIASAGSGFSLEASLRPLHTAGFYSLDLTLERCESRFDRKAPILVPADIGPPIQVPKGTGSTGPSDPREERTRIYLPFPLDLPEQKVWICRAGLAVSAGQPAVLKLEALPEGQGRMAVATLRVVQNQ